MTSTSEPTRANPYSTLPERRAVRRRDRLRAHHDGRAARGPRPRVQPVVRGRPLLLGRDGDALDVRRPPLGGARVAAGAALPRRLGDRAAARRGQVHLDLLDHRRPLRRPHALDGRDQPAPAPRRAHLPRPHARVHVVPDVPRRGVPRRRPGRATLHSLDYPYQGLVVEVVDAPEGGDRDELAALAARGAPAGADGGHADRDDAGVRAEPAAARPHVVRRGRARASSAASRCCRSPRCRPTSAGTRSPAPGDAVEAAGQGRGRARARRSSRRCRAPTPTSTSCARSPPDSNCVARPRHRGPATQFGDDVRRATPPCRRRRRRRCRPCGRRRRPGDPSRPGSQAARSTRSLRFRSPR